MSGTIKDKLEYLNETKREIRKAIISRNVNVDEDATFRSYADKIKSIQVTSNVNVQPLDATENKEYNAGEGYAYNPVTVNVTPNVKTKQINKAGTFKAKDDDCDGYSEVTVNVSTNLTAKNITSEDLPEEPNRVTFKPATDPDHAEFPDRLGYSEVSIDVSGKIGELDPITVDPANFGEEQIFIAKDDSLYGYSKVTVRVVESEGPFTVQFYNGNNLWETVTVEHKYSNAVPTRGYPEMEGKAFVGWDPEPYNVAHNMKCYAQFEEAKASGTTADGQTTKTWNQILANGGADLPPGTKKRVYFGPYTYNGFTIQLASMMMEVVSHDEPGTATTWFSINTLPSPNVHGWFYMGTNSESEGYAQNNPPTDCKGYNDTDLAKFLSNVLPGTMKSSGDDKSGDNIINGSLKTVEKRSSHLPHYPVLDGKSDEPALEHMLIDGSYKIWLPSLGECGWYKNSHPEYWENQIIYTFTHGGIPSGGGFRDISGWTISANYDRTDPQHPILEYAMINGAYATTSSATVSQTPAMRRYYRNKSGKDTWESYDSERNAMGIRIGFCT